MEQTRLVVLLASIVITMFILYWMLRHEITQ
jgi:hypothetical protein